MLTGFPPAYYAARYNIDLDLIARGSGFGYYGSVITNLVFASFTFIFFALEGSIMAQGLQLGLHIPLWLGYLSSTLLIFPLVIYGMNTGGQGGSGVSLAGTLLAAGVCLSLIAQIAEQVDYLRFMPPRTPENARKWWGWMLLAGPGWVILGATKQVVGLFLAVYLIANLPGAQGIAIQPVHQFLEIYRDMVPGWLAMTLAVGLVVISRSPESPRPTRAGLSSSG
jgi:hypothetical protein